VANLPDASEVVDDLTSLIDLAPTVLSLCGVDRPAWLHGQPFVGPAAVQREHAFATRDRFDEFYDMMRSCRDGRFRYVRNECPDLPRWLWSPYAFRHPAAQDLFAAHRENKLSDAQQYLFAGHRPVEELYDVQTDPEEVHNVALESNYEDDLIQLRDALDRFLQEHGDLGHEDESQMVERFWPGRRIGLPQPQTPPVVFVPIGGTFDGTRASVSGTRELTSDAAATGPVDVLLHCPCQGASIVVRRDDGPWQVYRGPIRVEAGANATFQAKAHRIGYGESETSTFRLTR
jgi:hypothetical protein